MKRALGAAMVTSVLAMGACSTSSSSTAASGPTLCTSDADCSGGMVCGYANTGSAADASAIDAGACSGARGVCVTPMNQQPTNLCGCGGDAIQLVVDDIDAGVYYWSGVIVGEKGFPPCGDAAIAPSSNDVDASGSD
jgi:hypothetical protein